MLSAQIQKNAPVFHKPRTWGKTSVGGGGLASQMLMPMTSEGLWGTGQLCFSFLSPRAAEWWRIKDPPTGAWLPSSRHWLCSCKPSFAFCPNKQGLGTAIADCTGVNGASTNLSPSPKHQHWESGLIWRQGFHVFRCIRLRILKWCHPGERGRESSDVSDQKTWWHKKQAQKDEGRYWSHKPQASDVTDCQQKPDNSSLNQALLQILFPSNLADTLILNLLAWNCLDKCLCFFLLPRLWSFSMTAQESNKVVNWKINKGNWNYLQ